MENGPAYIQDFTEVIVKVQIRDLYVGHNNMSLDVSSLCRYILILCSCYRQLRFSLYSGAVIIGTQFSLQYLY